MQAVVAVDGEAEHWRFNYLARVVAHSNRHVRARVHDVYRLALCVEQVHCDYLHLTGAPPIPFGRTVVNLLVVLGGEPCFLPFHDAGVISLQHGVGRSVRTHGPPLQPQRLAAQLAHLGGVVRHEDDTHAGLAQLGDPIPTLVLEGLVTYGEHLVDEQRLGIHVDGGGEAQAHVHA